MEIREAFHPTDEEHTEYVNLTYIHLYRIGKVVEGMDGVTNEKADDAIVSLKKMERDNSILFIAYTSAIRDAARFEDERNSLRKKLAASELARKNLEGMILKKGEPTNEKTD